MVNKVIIPARKNSKRLPGKNLIKLNGKELVKYSIEYALAYFDKQDIWVNSDDEKILEISKLYEINTYHRPANLATDYTPTVDVLKDQIQFFDISGIQLDNIVLLQVTNPLRTRELMLEAINLFKNFNRNSLATFSTLKKKYGTITNSEFIPKNYLPGQRMQDLEEDFFENGLLYITKKESVLNGNIITSDVYPYVVDDITSTVDIDEPMDLFWAEYLLKSNLFDEIV